MNTIIDKKNNEYDVVELLSEMTQKLNNIIHEKDLNDPVMIGIHSAGVWIAQHLHESLNIKEELGELNISFYRDDFSRIGLHPQIQPSKLPFSLENKHIILVDDVLYTGRTIRAAMNELFDYGRPASITLAVLIDRGNRELPVEAQVVGFKQMMEPDSYFKLSNDNNKLDLSIINRD
jgi:pyrimidine operon attenuation protein/uracil phosphoribosyltransferase